MSQQLEIEYKNMLTKEEFSKLTSYFSFQKQDFTRQVNHYFDTAAFSLKDQHSALRIREKTGKWELTLKQPAEGPGLLETTQYLSEEEAKKMVDCGELPSGPVANAIQPLINGDRLAYFGSLATERAEKPYKKGLIVLDHSEYLSTEDYELEYETEDPVEGKKVFLSLLEEQAIPVRKTENKVRRFYKQKQHSIDKSK